MKIPSELPFSSNQIIVLCVIIILSLGFLEYFLGIMISLSIFYLVPISLATWYKNKKSGLWIAFLSTLVWLSADFLVMEKNIPEYIVLVNSVLRFSFFIFVTLLLTSLQNALEREKKLARRDFLTDTWNRMAFYEILETENERSTRYKHMLSLVYLDLDNFKLVNDKEGHETGDKLLTMVTTTISAMIRKTDSLARLGGDEFAIMLPETNDTDAYTLLKRIQKELLKKMNEQGWPVTFSIGIVTFLEHKKPVQEMIREADDLMYSVKKSGKNNIKQKIFKP